MVARFQKFQLFAPRSSEINHFDALSLVLGLIWYIMYFTHTPQSNKMADKNGRRAAKIK